MRQTEVTEADILNVIRLWVTSLELEDAGDPDDLLARPMWHLFEAEQHLIMAACVYLGMPCPRNVAFSCMNTVEQPSDCEVVLFWAENPTVSLDPERFVRGTAVRLSEYTWPGVNLVKKRDEHIRYVIWRISLLKKTMDKEAPECISGR